MIRVNGTWRVACSVLNICLMNRQTKLINADYLAHTWWALIEWKEIPLIITFIVRIRWDTDIQGFYVLGFNMRTPRPLPPTPRSMTWTALWLCRGMNLNYKFHAWRVGVGLCPASVSQNGCLLLVTTQSRLTLPAPPKNRCHYPSFRGW